MALVSREVASSMQQINDSVKETEDVSGQLGEMIKRFKLADSTIFEKAINDHQLWKGRLERLIAGQDPIDDAQFVSHQACRFGKWLYGGALQEYGSFPQMAKIEPLHEEIHNIIGNVINALRAGEDSQAKIGLARFYPLSEQLCGLLKEMQKATH